ncbi:MAG: hypothetical protein PHW75_02050 [Patescibacteria group bacterium]|nr:hypothetical protein [Patescibacteria group bacterium]
MRSKILATVLILTTVVNPSVAVAEPTYEVKIAEKDAKIAKVVREIAEPYSLPTKDEKAQKQIEKYVKKLAEEKKKAEAKRKAEATKKATVKRVAVRVASSNVKVPDSNACVVAMKKVFPKNLWRIGYAIMQAESGARPNAIGGPNYNGTYDYGCWQINDTPRALDPDVGTKIAWYKYNHSGWYPWTVYKTGAYLRYF